MSDLRASWAQFKKQYLHIARAVNLLVLFNGGKKMGSIGMPELIIILVIALIIFGAGKLPQIGENMGKAIRNFKSATEREKIDLTSKKPEEISGESK